jgi:hypothetical protein
MFTVKPCSEFTEQKLLSHWRAPVATVAIKLCIDQSGSMATSVVYSSIFEAVLMTALGAPSFACTPDLFPDLMAVAIQKRDISAWAARNEIITR